MHVNKERNNDSDQNEIEQLIDLDPSRSFLLLYDTVSELIPAGEKYLELC
jgi:hypothetical protein